MDQQREEKKEAKT